MIANYFGYNADLVDLRRQFAISLKGATLAQLKRDMKKRHLKAFLYGLVGSATGILTSVIFFGQPTVTQSVLIGIFSAAGVVIGEVFFGED